MWVLPRPGIEPMSPALAGGFITTAPPGKSQCCLCFFFFFLIFIYLFIYFWLCWVFVSVRGLSLVAVSRGHSSSRCAGLSLSRPLLLRSTGSRRSGSVIVAHGPSCSAACGIFPDQGSNPCPLHWQADSQPLRHQGSHLLMFSIILDLYPEVGLLDHTLIKFLIFWGSSILFSIVAALFYIPKNTAWEFQIYFVILRTLNTRSTLFNFKVYTILLWSSIYSLSDIRFANIFSHYVNCLSLCWLFPLLCRSFKVWCSLIFLFLLLLPVLLVSCPRNHCQIKYHEDFPLFSSRSLRSYI